MREGLLALDVIEIGEALMINGQQAHLPEDGAPISGKLDVVEVERYLRNGYHIIIRFQRGDDRHFVIVHGIWTLMGDVLFEVFDTAGDDDNEISWLERDGPGAVDLSTALGHYGIPLNILLSRCTAANGALP